MPAAASFSEVFMMAADVLCSGAWAMPAAASFSESLAIGCVCAPAMLSSGFSSEVAAAAAVARGATRCFAEPSSLAGLVLRRGAWPARCVPGADAMGVALGFGALAWAGSVRLRDNVGDSESGARGVERAVACGSAATAGARGIVGASFDAPGCTGEAVGFVSG